MSDISQTNLVALSELEAGNDARAQHILRLNVKRLKNCMTFNNLGVFYYQYGMILSNGKIINAKKIGFRYLLKAYCYAKDWRNLASISTAFFEEGNIPLAYKYLNEIDNLRDNYLCLYNIGVCLYRLEQFHDALCIFMELYNRGIAETLCFEGGQHPLLICAYCYLNENNCAKCIKCVEDYCALCPENDRVDVFLLRCKCGMYTDALSEIQALMKEWYLSDQIISYIAECVSKGVRLPIPVMQFMDKQQTMLFECLINDKVRRNQIITKHIYTPPYIEMSTFMK